MNTITLTFGDCGENHVGMQKIGKLEEKGITVSQIKNIASYLEERYGAQTEIFDLSFQSNEASILIVRNGINCLLKKREYSADLLFAEQKSLTWDKKAYMRGRVVNKNARYNLCFGSENQTADYENKKGTIVSFDDVPITKYLRKRLRKILRVSISKEVDLICEGNNYYNIQKCGIGFHGDSERRVVIGCRLGSKLPLVFQWFERFKPIGEAQVISLEHGDIYIMSEKAVGFDWKKSSIPTLRHAAGCKQYTVYKK